MSKFANKITPIPGTQISVEQKYLVEKDIRATELQKNLELAAQHGKEKRRVKGESALLNTKIYFDTIVGQPIQEAENILNERDRLLNYKCDFIDSKVDIDRYFKNIALGRHHYVGFAASSGYQSINYQDDEWGNTALHIAVKKGHISTTEELLKHKADADVKNKIGNHAIHEAWFFWKTHHNRTRTEREEQENTTCELLMKLLSYNAFVDSQDLTGQTALHIACRLGPTRAVKILLSFKADIQTRTKEGKTAMDVALEYGAEESYKLMNSWAQIRKSYVHVDFHSLWHTFLQDHEAVISSEKTAETILAEIQMSSSIRKMERCGREHIVEIDDPLLRDSFAKTVTDMNNKTPKPWEPGWALFVKQTQAKGALEMKNQLEKLQTELKNKKLARLKENIAAATSTTTASGTALVSSNAATIANGNGNITTTTTLKNKLVVSKVS